MEKWRENIMFILSMMGRVLAVYSAYDLKSVQLAETWIRDHNMVIFSCETTQQGIYVITVKER